jgi:hypothetical protein
MIFCHIVDKFTLTLHNVNETSSVSHSIVSVGDSFGVLGGDFELLDLVKGVRLLE